ncbi:MAG TPA: RsiV family protein [Candidatus Paceibacterota bacterium]
MGRLAVYALILAAIAGAAYLAFAYIPAQTIDDTQQSPLEISTRSIVEEGDHHSILVRYPSFGLNEFDNAIDIAVQELAKEVRDQATEDKPGTQGFRKYELVGGYEDTYADATHASVRLQLSEDFGGAHPLAIIRAFNFDRQLQKVMGLDDALALIGLSLEQVAAEAKRELDRQLGDDVISPEGADPKPENYQTFLLSESAITFIFQPYQVAPYAAGAPEVSFPRR